MTGDSQLIDIELEAMAHGGSALGRLNQQVVFVPYTIPGERVRARIIAEKGRSLFAEGITLLDASADRVIPECPHFGPRKCGRCHWQHIDYAAQLLLKQDVLADQLERIGGFSDADVRPVIPSPETRGYNWNMTLHAVANGELGYLTPPAPSPQAERGSIFPITECHILHPDLLAFKHALDLDTMTGLRRITLRLGSDQQRMAIIETQNDAAPELETDLPMSVNLLRSDGIVVNLVGDLHTRYTVNGRSFRVNAGCDFRANLSQVGRLVEVIMQALAERESVLDLYGGVGLFSAFIAQRARLVTFVEEQNTAVNDAEINLADVNNVDIIEGAVEDVLESLEDGYDAVVLDAPQDGLNKAVIDGLQSLNIPRLVYISRDPATLARDSKRLASGGYQLTYAQPIDLSPQTYFIDTIAVFDRRSKHS